MLEKSWTINSSQNSSIFRSNNEVPSPSDFFYLAFIFNIFDLELGILQGFFETIGDNALVIADLAKFGQYVEVKSVHAGTLQLHP